MNTWTPTLSSSNVCQRCGGEYTKFVLECAVCFLLLNRNYCRELLLRGVRPIETFKKLDFQSLFRPQVGPLSAPLPLRQYHPQQRHLRTKTTAFATDFDKVIVHLKNPEECLCRRYHCGRHGRAHWLPVCTSPRYSIPFTIWEKVPTFTLSQFWFS